MAQPEQPLSVDWSVRVYRALLRAFPIPFRQDYSQEMMLVFRDLCRDAYHEHGAIGLVGLWGNILIDLTVNIAGELVMGVKTTRRPALQQGIRWGIVAGAVLGTYQSLSLFALQEGLRDNQAWRLVPLVALALCMLAGFFSARHSGQVRSGVQAGLLSGLVGALVFDVVLWIGIVAGMEALHHIPAEVNDYLHSGAASFEIYQFSEALGGSLYLLIIGPLLGAGLGAISGLVGRVSTRHPASG